MLESSGRSDGVAAPFRRVAPYRAIRGSLPYGRRGSKPPRARLSVDPPRAPGPLRLAKRELLHLAGGGLRERAELDRVRALVVREAVAAERLDLGVRRARAFLQGHEGLRPLAPALVGDRHDGALEDRGVRADRLLDLDGRDVLPAGDDHVLAPVTQLDGAVGMPHRQVARVEPAAL